MDKSQIPAVMGEKLFNPKKKAAIASILVERAGNGFKIVSFVEE